MVGARAGGGPRYTYSASGYRYLIDLAVLFYPCATRRLHPCDELLAAVGQP
jgi:hypothetical protein